MNIKLFDELNSNNMINFNNNFLMFDLIIKFLKIIFILKF